MRGRRYGPPIYWRRVINPWKGLTPPTPHHHHQPVPLFQTARHPTKLQWKPLPNTIHISSLESCSGFFLYVWEVVSLGPLDLDKSAPSLARRITCILYVFFKSSGPISRPGCRLCPYYWWRDVVCVPIGNWTLLRLFGRIGRRCRLTQQAERLYQPRKEQKRTRTFADVGLSRKAITAPWQRSHRGGVVIKPRMFLARVHPRYTMSILVS